MSAVPSSEGDARAERIAARAVAAGVGLIGFMVVWLLASRITVALLPVPMAPIAAMALAIVSGVAIYVRQTRRFAVTDIE